MKMKLETDAKTNWLGALGSLSLSLLHGVVYARIATNRWIIFSHNVALLNLYGLISPLLLGGAQFCPQRTPWIGLISFYWTTLSEAKKLNYGTTSYVLLFLKFGRKEMTAFSTIELNLHISLTHLFLLLFFGVKITYLLKITT